MTSQELTSIVVAHGYHSPEANRAAISVSQFKAWLECPSRWYHQYVACDWEQPATEALTLGTYLHTAVLEPEKLVQWCADHPEILSTRGPSKGQPKAAYQALTPMIDALARQPLCRRYLAGQHEVFLSQKIAGVWWRGQIDTLSDDGEWFSDLKSCRSIVKTEWIPPDYLPWQVERKEADFIYVRRYHYQMAMYQALTNGRTPYIVAVSKEDPPDVELFHFADQWKLDQCLEIMIKAGVQMAEQREQEYGHGRCGQCAYCRATKVITGALEA